MKPHELLDVLRSYPSSELHFEFADGRRLAAGYHITEVKNLSVESVDCGGTADHWKETIIQLWLPTENKDKNYMTAQKALDILEKVHAVCPLDLDSPLFFEAEDATGVSGHYRPEIIDMKDKLFIKLGPQKTACKAIDREIAAGVPVTACGAGSSDACCA